MFLLLRGYRRDSRRLVLAGWLVSAWQVSLGFTLGLQYAYLLLVLAAARARLLVAGPPDPGARLAPRRAGAAGHSCRHGTGRRDPATVSAVRDESRPRRPTRGSLIPRHLLAVTLIGVAVLGAVTVYQARPYLKVAAEYPTAKRTIREVETYSAGPAAFLSPPPRRTACGARSPRACARRSTPRTRACSSPAGLILVLALIGLVGLGGAGIHATIAPRAAARDRRVLDPRAWLLASPARAIRTGCSMTMRPAGTACACPAGSSRWPRCSTRCSPARACSCSWCGSSRGPSVSGCTRCPRCSAWCCASGCSAKARATSAIRSYPSRRKRGDRPARPGARPAHRRRAGSHLAVLLDRRLLQDPRRQQHLRHARRGRPARRHERLPGSASVEKLRYYGIKTVVLHTVLPKGLPPEQAPWSPSRPTRPQPRPSRSRGWASPPAGRLDRDLRDRSRAAALPRQPTDERAARQEATPRRWRRCCSWAWPTRR